jgi:hypothetical protein
VDKDQEHLNIEISLKDNDGMGPIGRFFTFDNHNPTRLGVVRRMPPAAPSRSQKGGCPRLRGGQACPGVSHPADSETCLEHS